MVPIQTLLALLALLTMVSCSQKPPPGVLAKQTVKKNPGDIITDDPGKAPDQLETFTVTAEGAAYWKFELMGEGAQKLFETTGVAEIDGKKAGEAYECIRKLELPKDDFRAYSCSFRIQVADGEVKNLRTEAELKRAEPSFKPEGKAYFSPLGRISLSAYPNKAAEGQVENWAFGEVSFLGKDAKLVYRELTRVLLRKDIPAGNDGGVDYELGEERFAKNVYCKSRPLAKNGGRHYWCTISLITNFGRLGLVIVPQQ
jgi:hypothetical protein